MANNLRPVDLEVSKKQETIIEHSEMKENISVPEKAQEKETSAEVVIETRETESPAVETPVVEDVLQEGKAPVTQIAPSQPVEEMDKLEEEIEDILEEDLKDLYLSMPPEKREEFREKGEETRSKVRELLRSAKVNAKKIFGLIRIWLTIIPGVNRFFLEQEAKIKTDKILLVSEEERKRTQNDTL